MAIDSHKLRQAGKIFRKAVHGARVPVKTVRANYDALLGTAILPNNIDRQEIDVGPVMADLLIPELAMGKRTILYAHGGGFISGSRLSSRNLCASIAHESASRLLLPEYRLAPEYPYPTALEDMYHAYSWLLHQGISSQDIVFAGDGAGANLVISLVHYLRSKSVHIPAGVIAISPWVNLSCDTASYTARKCPDPVFTRDILSNQALLYTFEGNFSNQNVSPIQGDFSDFPPLFIQCGSEEILIDDAKRLALKASNAGVSVILDVNEGMWHLFQAIDSLTPLAHLAVRKIGKWVRGGMDKAAMDGPVPCMDEQRSAR